MLISKIVFGGQTGVDRGAIEAWLRLYAVEGVYGEVDHIMTAFVELLLGWLARARRIEREKEHAALGAELLLVAGRVPARGEAFG